jgi:hypothetical protein
MDNGSVKSGSQPTAIPGHSQRSVGGSKTITNGFARSLLKTASIFRLGQPKQSRKSRLRD